MHATSSLASALGRALGLARAHLGDSTRDSQLRAEPVWSEPSDEDKAWAQPIAALILALGRALDGTQQTDVRALFPQIEAAVKAFTDNPTDPTAKATLGSLTEQVTAKAPMPTAPPQPVRGTTALRDAPLRLHSSG